MLDQTKLARTRSEMNMSPAILHQNNSVHQFDYRHIYFQQKLF